MQQRGIEAFALMGVGITFIAIRIIARIRTTGGFRKLQADDYLMVIAGAGFVAETYLAYLATEVYHGLANSGLTPAERKALSPSSEEYQIRVRGCKTHVAGWQSYVFVLWTIKVAWCVFYLRLVGVLMLRRRVYFGFFLVGSTWIAIILGLLLACRPLSYNWQMYPDPGPLCHPASSKLSIILVFVLNTITDFHLMGIPIPMILATSFSLLRKIGLVLLFSGGLFVTVASILKTVFMLQRPYDGGNLSAIWATRETFVAILMSNVPQILPLVRHWFIPSVRKISTRRQISTSTATGDGCTPSGAQAPGRPGPPFPLERKQSTRTVRRPRSPLALPTPSTEGGDSGFENMESSTEQTEGTVCSAQHVSEIEDTCMCTCMHRESDQEEEAPNGPVLVDGDMEKEE